MRSPLYVISGGDLGTTAGELDATLQRVFDIATSWKAIVLIDEVGAVPCALLLSLRSDAGILGGRLP